MLLVIGLDGATLDLARPWMEEGKLPNLARLCDQGQWGELQSTIPAATLPSWTTLMTGVNPGRHGVFDFTRRRPGTYEVSFVNSTFRKSPSIWRLLSDAGRRVAVLGMPGTYPPEPVHGCMISGFDAPVTTRANRSFIYPPSLADEVMRLGGFSFADFQEFYVGPGWYRTALSRLLQGIETKTTLARTLLAKENWDCFTLVFGETDTVSHHFWHFLDPHSPRHDRSGAVQFGDAIELVYRAVDAAIGCLLADAPQSRHVLVASDHGFGGSGGKAIHLNRWLAERDWLGFHHRGGHGVASLAKHAALCLLPARWQAPLFRSFNGRLANRLESQARFAGIDWKRTTAFSEELNYFPSIWINRIGREPLGQVADAAYDSTCEEIASALREWRDEQTGAPVVRRVWRRDEIYEGPWTELAPDLILDLGDDADYSFCCMPSGGESGPALRRLAKSELVGGKRFGMSGSHRPNGMFVLSGPDAGAAGPRRADIIDMAPTILRLCGVTPPEWMEGRSLIASGQHAPLPWTGEPCVEETLYPSSEEQVLEDRLRALGYIA